MPREDESIGPLKIERGESYVFCAEDFGDTGCKITLIDPRDNDILDKDKYHAVILSQAEMSILRHWLNKALFMKEI